MFKPFETWFEALRFAAEAQRVMALRMAITLGGTPIGAPVVGWVADRFGPRWSLGIGVAAGFAAAAVGLAYLLRRKGRPVRTPLEKIAAPPEGELPS